MKWYNLKFLIRTFLFIFHLIFMRIDNCYKDVIRNLISGIRTCNILISFFVFVLYFCAPIIFILFCFNEWLYSLIPTVIDCNFFVIINNTKCKQREKISVKMHHWFIKYTSGEMEPPFQFFPKKWRERDVVFNRD